MPSSDSTRRETIRWGKRTRMYAAYRAGLDKPHKMIRFFY